MMRKLKNGIATGGLRRNAFEPDLSRREAVGVDQAPQRRRQRDREQVSVVLDIRPSEQHL
jgi:hypothetical protein